RLDLRDNRIGALGLQAILTALQRNTVITQLDLAGPDSSTTLSAEDSEVEIVARLTREIRAVCSRNEAASEPAKRTHRRISLTCHTACVPKPTAEEERRGRLRSPAPSPAGSPIPAAHHSRFSVTRVTPERESSSESPSTPTRPAYCAAPSRFKVVQVSEPPLIQVHPASSQPRKSTSRFSVTRNYDSMYNPSPVPTDASPTPEDPRPATPGPPDLGPDRPQQKPDRPHLTPDRPETPDLRPDTPDPPKTVPHRTQASDSFNNASGSVTVEISDIKNVIDAKNVNSSESIKVSECTDDLVSNVCFTDKSERVSHTETVIGDTLTTETKIVKNSTDVREKEKVDVLVEVTVTKEHSDQNVFDFKNIDEKPTVKNDTAMKQIEAITEDLGNLIQEFKDLSTKNVSKVKSDCTQTDVVNLDTYNVPVNIIRENVVLKKNKSESSLDSPDLEVSRLMNKKLGGSPFCDSSSSLEISGSSVESLNTLDNPQSQIVKPIIIESDTELDRRKTDHVALSTESSIESNTSEVTPVNSNFLNMSVSSNESVSPIIFGKSKKIHDSLSSLEASVSSLDSGRHEKVMITSADSGIEYSLQQPSESKEDNSSNEGTLTNNSSLKETVKKDTSQDVTSPKRTSSLLDVPALKTKGLSERLRKISLVAPSPSFHIPKPEPEKEIKLPSHLDKLLSLFQHPLFSRSSNEEEKKGTNTPPRKDSSLTSSFWSWGSATEKEDKEDRDSSSEATDSTLSERVQVSFVDESFSKKLDSKTPSTDTDNTLSEFQTFPQNSEASESQERVTDTTTDDNLVQKCLVISKFDNASSNGNKDVPRTSDNTDLIKPNDLNKNYDSSPAGDTNKNPEEEKEKTEEVKTEPVRPRSFASVLKYSGSENSLDKQNSPDSGQPVDKLPSKVIRGIKENISPENTLTSSMTNTKTLALELTERQVKNQPIVNAVWEVTVPVLEKNEPKTEESKAQTDVRVTENLAPIATIEEACDEADNIALDFIDDPKFDEKNTSADSGVTSLEGASEDKKFEKVLHSLTTELEHVDLGKDALSYLIYENPEYEARKLETNPPQGSLAQELQDAEIKEMLDLSPELIIDEAIEVPEVFTVKEIIGIKTSPVIPERAKIKKSNSLEDLSQEKECPKTRTIAFKVPEILTTTPRDIPERRSRLRTRSGSSPKSLPESLNKPCPLSKMDSILSKKKKKVSSLGKMAKDSLLALNMSEDEIAEFRRSYKLTSVESLKSLESVSEDANSQSGNSIDSRCKVCLRTSQESLMSLDSITEDCRCTDDCEKPGQSNR
ncbi:uncharacterized protein LOC114359306, partial [Ostrinia furnacalis]|uniref:uncharacterized protein LOC114359306 n=1 Tax=Ostrinia furnacalis TaxID=93504 RepID=UPI00103E5488